MFDDIYGMVCSWPCLPNFEKDIWSISNGIVDNEEKPKKYILAMLQYVANNVATL